MRYRCRLVVQPNAAPLYLSDSWSTLGRRLVTEYPHNMMAIPSRSSRIRQSSEFKACLCICSETMLDASDPREQTPLLKDGNGMRSPLEGGALHRIEGDDQGEQCFGHASESFQSHAEKDSTEKIMIMCPKPDDS